MKKLLLVLVLVVSGVVRAQEVVNLTSPITKPTVSTLTPSKLNFDLRANQIYVEWIGETGETFSANYSTPKPVDHPSQPTGAALLTTLNKMNFAGANPSFIKRVLQELQTDGYIAAGTITGTPQ